MVRLSSRVIFSIVSLASIGVAASQPPQVAPPFAAAEPGVSADGSEIAFTSGGDIWSVPTAGGDARLLISHEATERRPLYSPDGRSLAFMSTRTGGGDIYTLSLDTGALRRVTSDDGAETLEAWAPDSRWIYFSSTSRDIAGMNDVFRVSAQGGTPMLVSDDRYVNGFPVAPYPG